MSTKSISRLFVITLLALGTGLNSYAGDIIGQVQDANTGRNLPGVNVRIPGTNRNTTTDRDGRYRFGNINAGSYTVQAEYMGYDPVSKAITVSEIGTVTNDITVGQEVVELEAYEVEGYREGRSLALQQKRTADNIKDILSADSVGQIPDRNVADALVRLPGVAVQMSNGEGRFVSIRGIAPDLNNVTVNGSTVANPGVDGRAGRAMPLDVIGSASISQLEVIKTVTPDMDAQGLGGTVEIKTASAFDREEGWFNGSVEGSFNQLPDKYGYRGEATWADRFGPDRKWGIALSASYEFRPYQNDAVDMRWDKGDFLTDYDNDGLLEGEVQDYAYIADLEIIPEFGDRKRIGLNTRVEFRPDEDTEFYLNGIWNQFTENEEGIEVTLEGDRLDYDEDQQYLTDGGSRDDRLEPFLSSPTLLWFPTVNAIQHRIGIEKRIQSLVNLTLGGRKRWDNFTLSGEITFSNAEENVEREGQIQFRGRFAEGSMTMRSTDSAIGDFNGIALPFFIDPEADGLRYDESNQRLAEIDGPTGGDAIPVLFDYSGARPNVKLPQQVEGDGSRWAHRRNRIDSSLVEENTYIPRVDLQWDTDNFLGTGNSGFLKAGIKYFDRNRSIDDKSFRPNFCDESVDLQECLDRGDILFRNGNPIRPSAAAFPNLIVPAETYLGQYSTGVQLAFEPAWTDSMGGFDPRNNPTLFPWAFDSVESSENNIEDDYDLDEKITGLYLMFSTDIGEKLTVLGGVRYEKTDVNVKANIWTRFDDFGGEIEPPCDTFDPNAGKNFCLESSTSSFDYEDVFPSIQGIYRFNDNLQLRVGFTTTTGRPNFEDAAPITRVENELTEPREYDDGGALLSVGEVEARARIRNPALKPYYSKNFDISLEYFTDWGGAFSVAAFHKDIDNPIFSFETDDRFRDNVLDVNDPEFANNVTIADAVVIVENACNCDVNTGFLPQDDAVARLRMEGWDNAESGKVSGVEFAAGMPLFFLPDIFDGLGIDANVSLIDSEIEILERADFDEKTPFFQQPSTIANVALWYQRSRWQARIAWRYQDESFDEVNDPNDNFSDWYSAPRQQWDAQASYRFTDNWTAYVNVQNLTDEEDIRWWGNTSSRPGTIEQFGRTWRVGARWNY